jgi:hypothetical protein
MSDTSTVRRCANTPNSEETPMQYTVIGVWQDDEPVVAGVVPGRHEVYGGDEASFSGGLWLTHVTATDVAEAEQLAKTEAIEHSF